MNPRFVHTTAIGLLIAISSLGIAQTSQRAPTYPFGSSQFAQFVADSNLAAAVPGARDFQTWWRARFNAAAHPELPGANLDVALETRGQLIRAESNLNNRAVLETKTAAQLHALVKRLIPKFSFEHGFEFTSTVSNLERQCLLQSVLIVSMLERAGVNAGTIMVWKSQSGEESNLGHVVVLLRRSDGRDILVDASDATPFMRHQGLFGFVQGRLHFVKPRFAQDATITAYTDLKSTRSLKPLELQTLTAAYVRSQFFYYRGERAKNGFMGTPSTSAGLERSARFLQESIRLEPNNPLAQYVLGHVYRRLGKLPEARIQYAKGYALYQEQGYVPFEPLAAMKNFVWKTP